MVLQIWRKWLRRRSNKARKTWGWWTQLLERHPLPPAYVVHPTCAEAAVVLAAGGQRRHESAFHRTIGSRRIRRHRLNDLRCGRGNQ